ncbi:MAG: GIY-YIG nuclease family protein [Hyphomicrobium sp.]
MDRDQILSEIRRTAEASGGTPLGVRRLESEAGIKPHHWQQHWARFSDAQKEAGFKPNGKSEAYGRERLLGLLVELTRKLGRFPTGADIRLQCANGDGWPTHRVFERTLGAKSEMVAGVAATCRARSDCDDVLALCEVQSAPLTAQPEPDTSADGFVYLLRSGRYYKIGKTNHVGRRERELAIQLPDAASTVHSIKTDDPEGIEAYWHRRFASKRKNGEWFELDRTDVAAFRRRKFM